MVVREIEKDTLPTMQVRAGAAYRQYAARQPSVLHGRHACILTPDLHAAAQPRAPPLLPRRAPQHDVERGAPLPPANRNEVRANGAPTPANKLLRDLDALTDAIMVVNTQGACTWGGGRGGSCLRAACSAQPAA